MRATVLLLLFALMTLAKSSSSVRVTYLRCEYRVNPMGIDVVQPRLSWVLAAVSPRAQHLSQSAYRILAASSAQLLSAGKGDLWDSGKVSSDRSIQVAYAGKALGAGARVFWKVEVWDQSGNGSAWSDPALWSMGLLQASDWKARWIGLDDKQFYRDPASPYQDLTQARWIWAAGGDGEAFFRLRLRIPEARQVTRALCVMGADSAFDAQVNGVAVGRGSFVAMPAVLDVTRQMNPGDNILTVHATHSDKGKGALIGAMRIEFSTGEPMIVRTGAEWVAAAHDRGSWDPPEDRGQYGVAPWGPVGFSEERALPARWLRKEFDTTKTVRRATVYASGLGLYELHVNGRRIGDHVLAPGLTDYDKRVLYETFDVTGQIGRGRNAIALVLGNGRYWAPRETIPIPTRSFGYPKALVQLEVEYEDNSVDRVVSDESWKVTTEGPIRANNEYDGETYDATKELAGWDEVRFDDSQWQPVQVVKAPEGILAAQMAEPIRAVETVKPVSLAEPRPGIFVFDMGQNMVGWCRLRVAGVKGTNISLSFAETLSEDGTLYVDNLRSARATDHYILRGGGNEEWEPRFTYHGFRYVEMHGFPGRPDLNAIEGLVVQDAMQPTAEFTSSNALLNRIHKNIFWGVRGNYRSIPTDCPQRDERQGWLGDRSIVSRSESYLFDVAAFYSKWMTDLADSQRPAGSIPDVSPNYWTIYNDDVTWPSTFLLVPGMLYDQYGETRVIERNYPAMKKWIEYMRGFMKDGLMPKDTYGDWCVPPESPKLIHSQDPARQTDKTLLGTAYYYKLLGLMARYARLLDKKAEAGEFDALAAQVKSAYDSAFYRQQAAQFSNGTQTSSVVSLALGLTPEEDREQVFGHLVSKIERESNGHLGVGLIGAQWLMRSLSDSGRPDVAYQIATQTTYPGWGYMIEKGATTIWELWNGDTADPAMNSGNHVMQIGDLGIWMYEYLGGIRSDPEGPGFKKTIIRPFPVEGLIFVKAAHQSMYGRIASSWRREGKRFFLDVSIPVNTTATVYVPGESTPHVIGSGQYSFESTL